MKNWISKILLLGVATAMLWSCEKDEDRAILSPTTNPTLTADTTGLTLSQANATANALTITWTAADFGFNAGISYSLQISREGSNFASATTTEITLGTKPGTRTFTEKEINGELLKVFGADISSDAEVRIKASVNNLSGGTVQSVYSNVIKMVVRPYRDIILYSWPDAINVAGNYQNWSPETAPQLVRASSTSDIYEGFINFNNGSPEFKFVKGNNWGAGDFGSAGGSALGNGGANLTLGDGAGIYYVRADVGSMTWSNYKVNSWGLIGSATPDGWNSDQNMTYNAGTKLWTITLNLVAGEIKFRANDDWAVNLGDNAVNGVRDGKPEINGANIPIATPGSYTINLDLETGGNWFYTIKKN